MEEEHSNGRGAFQWKRSIPKNILTEESDAQEEEGPCSH